jgi:long-chain acyl-CoA synthetase
MNYSEKPWLKFYHEEIGEQSNLEVASVTDLITRAAQNYGDQTSLTFYHKSWSFKEVFGTSEQFANCLHGEGFRKGDRLAVMLPNTPHYIFSLFGTTRLGGIVAQVNPMYVEREIEYLLNDSGAETMIVLDALYPRVKAVQGGTSLKKVIVVSLGQQEVQLQDGDILFEDFMNKHSSKAPAVEINPAEDVAVLQYTGGTTGVSKGVMLTHRNIVSNLEQTYDFMFKALEDTPASPKVMNILPMFHIYGLTCVTFMGFRAGFNQIILPRFDVQEVLDTVKREKPYQFSGVPTMYIGLNSHPKLEEYGFNDIKYYNSGGAAMPVEQLHLFERRTGANLCEGYGLSEASPVTHFNPPFQTRNVGSIGIPLPSTEVRVINETEAGVEEVPVGEIGELIIKGPQIMKGYWNKPEETQKTLRDGWLFTGDLGRMDKDGYFYIVDRKKDMIIASGYNVYPREIEEVLYQHSNVQEVSVVGVPDEYRGETVKAFVTVKQGSEVTEEELLEHSRKYLAAYKVPRFIEFRDQLPKSAVGKLLKRELRDEEVRKQNQQKSS